jgi:hypothetical protein
MFFVLFYFLKSICLCFTDIKKLWKLERSLQEPYFLCLLPNRALTNIKQMFQEDFDENILNYNTTPKKSLVWLAPLEVFKKNLARVAL